MPGSRFSLKAVLAVALATSAAASTADYIIVGGGPAGFVLAEQLSENPSTQVVLLEAGPDAINDPLVNTPAYYPLIKQYFWNFTSAPDPNLGGQAPQLAQGRTYGGGSAVNGQAYCRGASSVFDQWAQLSGNPGLAWNSLLQDFRAVSHYGSQPGPYQENVDTSVYGNGPVEVSKPSQSTGFDQPFAQALASTLGLKQVDMDAGAGIGYNLGLQSISVHGRTRSYARIAYGPLIQNRPNVQMISNAWVHNIGFSKTTAVNVTYLDQNTNKDVTLSAKEIIVSAGAINSPKLLMLSGVGPKASLSNLGIPVVSDNPAVGQNLYDHLFPVVEVAVTPDIMTVWQWASNTTEEAIAKSQYSQGGQGPLGNDNGLVFGTFRVPDSVFAGVNGTHYTSLPSDRPHILMEYSGVPFDPAVANISAVTGWASLVQPEASGYVALASANYKDNPTIFSNYYGSDADKKAVIYGYKQLRQVMGASSLKPYVKSELYPGSNVTSDDQIWAAIQQQSYSFHHPMGTVAIGKALDSNWRLNGLQGIRVVDVSTFPYPPSCHPQATVYALAHRAAADIRKADGN